MMSPKLPPNNLKALHPFREVILATTDLSRAIEEHCRIHRAARIYPLQTPLWCDRFENCLDCIIKFCNHYQPSAEK